MDAEFSKKAEALFESYNLAVARCYDEFFSDRKNQQAVENLKERNNALNLHIYREIEKWSRASIGDIGGITPAEFINNISDFDGLFELFKMGSRLTDESLPAILTDKLKSYGDKAIGSMLELIKDLSNLQSEEEIYAAVMAMRLLGQWKVERAVEPLIAAMAECDDENDLIMDTIVEALSLIGEAAADHVIKVLDDAAAIGYKEENFLSALTTIGLESRSDKIFRCLKNTFLKMDNKILGAACLGDYGDGRAIPVLRGYVEKNRERISRELFFEIKSAVERLGGAMDDIQVRFCV